MTTPTKSRWLDGPVPWIVLFVLSLALYVPGLGSFGFWDPYEIKLADMARSMADGKFGWTVPSGGHSPGTVWLIALGFKWLGIGEFGGRFFGALAALAVVLLTFGYGQRLVSRRAAFLGSLGLLLAPGFVMSARQLTSFALPTLLTLVSVGGLLVVSDSDERQDFRQRAPHLIAALLAAVANAFVMGAIFAFALPALVALVVLVPQKGRRAAQLLVIAIIATASAFAVAMHTKGYSIGLGGNVHSFQHTVVWSAQLKQLGFAFFPWIAAFPLALGWLLLRSDAEAGERRGAHALAAWIVLGYGLVTMLAATTADLIAPVGPALALAVGAYFDDALDRPAILPFEGFVILLVALFIGHDFVLQPEEFISAHVAEQVRWPGVQSRIPQALVAVAALWGGLAGLALGVPLASPKASKTAEPGETSVADQQQARGRRFLLGGALVTMLGLAVATAAIVVPEMSKHLSARDIYGKTRQLNPNAPIGQYRFNASGASYYAGGQSPVTLNSLDELFRFLGRSERVFIMAGADELAALDQAARQRTVKYYVIDDSNSRYLVLSNQLGTGEPDKNPLRQFVLETPPKPPVAQAVNFEDKLELLGYDVPTEVARGSDFKVRLYFKVNAVLPGNWKIFLHFDGGGSRFHGDHVPVGGRFPTNNWVPGTYIVDEYTVSPDRSQQPTGNFQVYFGLFQGDKRLKVTMGDHDGENRVKLNRLHVR